MRQAMYLHTTASTLLLSPGNDRSSVSESATASPMNRSVQKKNPDCSLSPCPRNHVQTPLRYLPRPSHNKRASASPGNADHPRARNLTSRLRGAADTWDLKRQHTTWSRSGTAQISTKRLPRFGIAYPVCAFLAKTTRAART